MDSFLIPPSHFLSLPPSIHDPDTTERVSDTFNTSLRITVTPYNQPRFHPSRKNCPCSFFAGAIYSSPPTDKFLVDRFREMRSLPSVRACAVNESLFDAWRKLIFKGLFAWREIGERIKRNWARSDEYRNMGGGIFGYTSDSIRGWLSYRLEFGERRVESALRRLV